MLKTIASWTASLALIAILVVMLMPVLGVDFRITRWIYTFAAPLYLAARLVLAPGHAGEPLRARRLRRLEVWSAIFFCVAAVLTWIRSVGQTDWVAFTLAGAIIILYVNFMLPRALKKE